MPRCNTIILNIFQHFGSCSGQWSGKSGSDSSPCFYWEHTLIPEHKTSLNCVVLPIMAFLESVGFLQGTGRY